MNQDKTTAVESAIQLDSDDSSDSPAPYLLANSEIREDDTSSRTSTPSQQDMAGLQGKPHEFMRPKRQDSYSRVFSQSLPSTSAASVAASSMPKEMADLSLRYQTPQQRRRPSSSRSGGEERSDLVSAAEGLLSCSLGTPKHRSVQLPPDVPPVPPLPAQFLGQTQQHTQQTTEGVGERREHPFQHGAGPPTEEDDDGVFGRMEQ